jgi:hypothetical protein
VPEEVKADPQAWRRIGEEVSKRLDFEPGSFAATLCVRSTCAAMIAMGPR